MSRKGGEDLRMHSQSWKWCQEENIKEMVGKTSERKLLRNELQIEVGVEMGDPGDGGWD